MGLGSLIENRMKSLSICILIYRRPKLRHRCIASAISVAETYPVRISVTDDPVSEVNRPAMEDLCRVYPFVYWHHNDINLGIDWNIQRVVDLSDSDYTWVIGEDDQFPPGSMPRTCRGLCDHDGPPWRPATPPGLAGNQDAAALYMTGSSGLALHVAAGGASPHGARWPASAQTSVVFSSHRGGKLIPIAAVA